MNRKSMLMLGFTALTLVAANLGASTPASARTTCYFSATNGARFSVIGIATARRASTACRRAERRAWALVASVGKEEVNDQALIYLNRLSDLLFVMARWLNRDSGIADVLWERQHTE